MKRLKSNTYLIVLALAFVAFASSISAYWFASKKESQDIKDLNKKISQLSKPASTSPSKMSATNQPATSYAVIKEFGVKFPYSENPKELGYVLINNKVNFDTESLAELANQKDPSNSCASSPGNLGSIYQAKQSNNLPAVTNIKNDGVIAQINGYYYIYTHPVKYCSTDSTVRQEQDSQAIQVLNDLKKLQAS